MRIRANDPWLSSARTVMVKGKHQTAGDQPLAQRRQLQRKTIVMILTGQLYHTASIVRGMCAGVALAAGKV